MQKQEPIRKNFTSKDESLVGKLNVMSEFMNQIPEKPKVLKQLRKYSGTLMQDQSEETKMLVTEITKVLFLNNQDPKKVFKEYSSTTFLSGPITSTYNRRLWEMSSIMSPMLFLISTMKKKQEELLDSFIDYIIISFSIYYYFILKFAYIFWNILLNFEKLRKI